MKFIIALLFLFSFNNAVIEAQLFAPSLITPEHKSGFITAPTEFIWNSVTDVDCYSVEITTDVTFLKPDTTSDIIISCMQDTIYIPDSNKLIIDTMYFWRVKAIKDTAESDWSFIRMFVTGYKSIKEINPEIQITPQPINDFAAIKLIQDYDDLKYFVFNYLGILIEVNQFSMDCNMIDFSKYDSGNYYIIITSKNKIISTHNAIKN